MKIKSLLPVLMCVSLFACGSDDNAEPPAELTDIEETSRLSEQWSVSANDGIGQQYLFLEPLLAGDELISVGRNGILTAVDLANGEVLRETHLDIGISAGVGGDADNLYLASEDGKLIAIDNKAFTVRWQIDVPSEILATPVVAGEAVIVRTTDGRVQSYDAATGSLNWSYIKALPALTLRGIGRPVVTREHVIVGQEDGKLTALTLDKGDSAWTVTLSTASGRSETQRLIDVDGRSELYGHVLYAVGFQGRLAAIDLKRGQVLWARAFSSETGVSVSESVVYVTDERGHVWAIDRYNGATLWKQDALTARRVTRPVIIGDKLVVGDYEGVLHVLSAFSGQFVTREHPGDEDNGILLAPMNHQDKLLVTLRDGEILAYKILDLAAE